MIMKNHCFTKKYEYTPTLNNRRKSVVLLMNMNPMKRNIYTTVSIGVPSFPECLENESESRPKIFVHPETAITAV